MISIVTALIWVGSAVICTWALTHGAAWVYHARWRRDYKRLVQHAIDAGWVHTQADLVRAGSLYVPYIPLQVTEAKVKLGEDR
jgi:hypothetical protein